MQPARPFAEMTALLVGATSGIGLETAAQLAEAGVPRLHLVGRGPARGAAAVAAVTARAPGATVRFHAADAAEPAALARVVASAAAGHGLDMLLHAVPGVSPPAPFARLDPAVFDELVRLHLLSAWHAAGAVLPHLVRRGGGTLIFVSSDAAKIPTPGESVHGSLMAAIAMFARTLALEEARNGVRVHALTPSIIADTISHDRMMADSFGAKLFEKAKARAGLGVPVPADVAALAVFLTSPAASRMTGQTLTVNGGLAVA
jgi:NAD(P)-dependent dehydrogenase (short-subunit alcohol dehydrogenase family)